MSVTHDIGQEAAPEQRPRRRRKVLVIAAAVVAVGGLAAGLTLGLGGSPAAATVHVPAPYASAFVNGAENGKYGYYALAGKVPAWDSVAKTGVFVCSLSRPSLIPRQELGVLSALGAALLG